MQWLCAVSVGLTSRGVHFVSYVRMVSLCHTPGINIKSLENENRILKKTYLQLKTRKKAMGRGKLREVTQKAVVNQGRVMQSLMGAFSMDTILL